ncbi:helix-turn-helix domain-containing protein [Paenibacillus lautus]|uniref:helix-turn-helix domain-containing protein n=1 Tax=Paenibacillus lautus TaxID=1401 RepID=UPI003D2771BC
MKKSGESEPYEKEFLELIAKGFRLLVERREQEIRDEIARQAKSDTKEIVTTAIETEQQLSEREVLPPVCTISDIMDYFKVSRTTVSKLINSEQIKSYKIGNKARVKREWVLEYEETLITKSNNKIFR